MPRFSGLKNLKSRKTTIFLVVTLGKSCVTCFNIYQRKSLKNNLINKQASLKDMQTQNFIPVSDPPTEQVDIYYKAGGDPSSYITFQLAC